MSKTHIIRLVHIGSVLKMAQHSSLLQQINFSELDHNVQVFINTSENHRAGVVEQPFWTELFLSKKLQGYPTINGEKNCLSSTQPLLFGKF